MANDLDSLIAAQRSGNLLAAIASPAQINPLAANATALQMAGTAAQFQKIASERAAGQAFLDSIGPNGTTDQAGLLTRLKADPTTAYSAQQAAQAGQTLSSEEYGQRVKRLATGAAGALQILADNNGTAPIEEVRAYVQRGLADGHFTPADVAGILNGFGDDPVANARIVLQRANQAVGATQALVNTLPQGATASLPQGVVPYRTAPRTGPNPGAISPAGDGLAAGTSPEFQQAPVPGPADAQNRPTTITRQQSIDLATGGGRPGGGQVPTPSGLPPSLRNPSRQAAPDAGTPGPGASATPPPGIQRGPGGVGYVSGPSPQQIAANERTGGHVADYFQAVYDAGNKAQQQGAMFSTMISEAARFPTGPVKINDAKAFIQRYAPGLAPTLGIKPEQVAAGESLEKMLAQIADAQAAGSDARLAVIQKGNPSSALTPEGLNLILRQLQGNADFLRTRADLAREWPEQTDRRGFDNFATQLNPQVFQYNRLTPEQKTEFFHNLTKADKKQFKSDFIWAQGRGYVGNAGQ